MDYLGGVHAVKALVERYPRHVKAIWLTKDHQHAAWFLEKAQCHGIPVSYCLRSRLDEWLPGVTHQGVAAHYHQLPSLGLDDLIAQCFKRTRRPLLLALDRIQDPQNLGACIRSAAVFGVDGILIPKDRAVGLTPAVLKVAVGAAAIVPVVRVSNLSRALRRLKEDGFWCYGTSEYAQETVSSADVNRPVVWVMGNETKGLSRNVLDHCDQVFSIETSGFSTLNIATSASICLYATWLSR